jgi:hypothetical protein
MPAQPIPQQRQLITHKLSGLFLLFANRNRLVVYAEEALLSIACNPLKDAMEADGLTLYFLISSYGEKSKAKP